MIMLFVFSSGSSHRYRTWFRAVHEPLTTSREKIGKLENYVTRICMGSYVWRFGILIFRLVPQNFWFELSITKELKNFCDEEKKKKKKDPRSSKKVLFTTS